MIDWPIGAVEERAAAITKLPGKWENDNPYLHKYKFGYHTGADLNLNSPHWNQDKDAPVYAVADGPVIFSGIGRGKTWGWLIIQECDGFWVRYAHVNHKAFRPPQVGDRLVCGQQIALIGDADGYYAGGGHHLHFDIAITNVLSRDASDWPGLNSAKVRANYVDPIQFIIQHKQAALPVPESDPDVTSIQLFISGDGVHLRQQPRINGSVLYSLNRGTALIGYDLTRSANGHTWQLVEYQGNFGFVASEYLMTKPITPP